MRSVLYGIALFFCWINLAQADELKAFDASYTADASQMPLGGSAKRSLVKEEGGLWRLAFSASMLIASLNEGSLFRLQDGQPVPINYFFNRNALGKARETRLNFDWANQQITGSYRNKAVNLPLSDGILDKSTYQIALQADVAAGKQTMSYPIVDGNEIETLSFRVAGEEVVKTEAGSIAAIKVERVREADKNARQTRLWFAKDWDFLLVRLEQVEKDGKAYQIMLKQGTVGGRTVKGR